MKGQMVKILDFASCIVSTVTTPFYCCHKTPSAYNLETVNLILL